MPIKLRDLAEKTGYSITTVSRALAGYDDVNHETRRHIIEMAQMLGYQPNHVARQLRSQRTQTLGFIIPTNDRVSAHDFFTQLLLGISDTAASEHYDVLISGQIPGEEEMNAYRRIVGGNRVDGMILARTRRHDERIAYLQTRKHPFVTSGRGAPSEPSDFPFIDLDSQTGIRLVTEHFLANGHQHIGLILPPDDIAYTEYRHQGYREALERAGLPYRADYVLYGDLLRDGGYACANRLLDQHPQITALVCCNDLMALGAIQALKTRGLRVGQDVGVSGFDDIPLAEYTQPSLTTIRQPIYEIGRQLVNMLVSIISGKSPAVTQVILPPELIVRESSGGRRTE
jgi:LacI family transcriptional regulator